MHGDWNRRWWNATTNSTKKEAGIPWTCYAIRLVGKRNDAGIQKWKGEEKMTKEKMDGWDTWSNWNEAGGTKRQKGNIGEGWSRQTLELKELTAQSNKVNDSALMGHQSLTQDFFSQLIDLWRLLDYSHPCAFEIHSFIHSFVHSFIADICIAPLQVGLLRSSPNPSNEISRGLAYQEVPD